MDRETLGSIPESQDHHNRSVSRASIVPTITEGCAYSPLGINTLTRLVLISALFNVTTASSPHLKESRQAGVRFNRDRLVTDLVVLPFALLVVPGLLYIYETFSS